jgi:hypothetical protein
MKALLVDNVLLEQTAMGFLINLQPHLGLISLIAALRGSGHEAELYDPKVALTKGDLSLGPGLYRAAAEQILAREPEVVGFTSLGCNFTCTLQIAAGVRRRRPDIPILLGGPHASIIDREILERHEQFDVIVRGEAEATIGGLFEALGGVRALETVDGLTYRRNGRVARTQDAGPILDLDTLPMPAYDAFPIEELQLSALDVDAGRGCPFHCAFCSTASFFGRRYRIKSAQRLVAELDTLAARYGIRDFNLTHDLFTVNKQSVRAFCAAVAERGYGWNCSARMDCVDDALLKEMREAGCNAIYYGVETGSQRLQRVVDKRLDLTLYHPRVRSSLALGFKTTVSFITGFPAETPADRDETLELIRESVADHPSGLQVQLHLLVPEPGTALHAQHAPSLAYDGHVSDFNFPLLEPEDPAIIASDPEVFACHHYYADGGHRAEDIAITRAFHTLYRLGHVFLTAVLRRYGGSFANLLFAFAHMRERSSEDDTALADFIRERWGPADAYYDIVRYILASTQVDDDGAPRAGQAPRVAEPPPGHMRLTRRAVPLGEGRDGAELLRRLQAGQDLEAGPLERSPHLLVGAPGRRFAQTMFAIDELTCELAMHLKTPTSRERLAAGRDPGEVERRLWALDLMGVVVSEEAAPVETSGYRKLWPSAYLLSLVR